MMGARRLLLRLSAPWDQALVVDVRDCTVVGEWANTLID
jgi:hypothetical protein